MSRLRITKEQIDSVKSQTEKLIHDLPSDLWMVSPEILDTNINWQIGHVFLANYLHGVASITGINSEIRNMIDVKKYIKFYGMESDPRKYIEEKPSKEKIIKLYEFGFQLINNGLEQIDESDIDSPTEIPNPAVKTKYQALMWLFKHQSWHNGQIATLKRVLNKNRV